jgi:hypothetical protein
MYGAAGVGSFRFETIRAPASRTTVATNVNKRWRFMAISLMGCVGLPLFKQPGAPMW